MNNSRLPGVVWLLSLVSLCMDLSSEMIHSLLPVFLVTTLGASTVTLGLIEGVAEGTASIAKVFSGVLSDRLGRRKPLVVFGYGLSALIKPLFPLASSPAWVLGARFCDRIGKGIRGAPRDALLADATPAGIRGAAYGLRQTLDTAGALLAPLAAIALMAAFHDNVRAVFWVATIPAIAAVAILLFGVDEPPPVAESLRSQIRRGEDSDASSGKPRRRNVLPTWNNMKQLGGPVWSVVAIGALFALARFSEAFLVLRAHDAGLSLAWTPLVLVVMNFTYVISAYPAGRWSDRIGRVGLSAIGLVVLIAADIVLAATTNLTTIMLGVALWGLHMGLTQGLLSAMVADAAPPELRGSAFGVFYLVSGIAALIASLLAGGLWHWVGPATTFFAGAAFSAIALAGLLWWRARFA